MAKDSKRLEFVHMDPCRLPSKNLPQMGLYFFLIFLYVAICHNLENPKLRHIETIVIGYKKEGVAEALIFYLQSKGNPFFLTSSVPILPFPSYFHPSHCLFLFDFVMNLHQGPICLALYLAFASSLSCFLLRINATHAAVSQMLWLKVHLPFPTFVHSNRRIEKVL